MAGDGVRFANSDYKTPKPLIDVFGAPMIQRVIENLNIDANFTFIVREEHQSNYQICDILRKIKPNSNIIEIDYLTDGPARTALLAEQYIDESELFIVNCDQIIRDFNIDTFLEFSRITKSDGILGCFISSSPKNSYVKLNDVGEIIDIKEKIVISNVATNGLHYWKNGKYFVYSTNDMISNSDRYNNEFYIAPSYKYLLSEGKKILPFFYNLHFPIGIPSDLDTYKDIYENF